MPRRAFAFRKWYIDCLDADGRLAILYWTSLEYGALSLKWHSAIQCGPATRPRSRSSVIPCSAPAHAQGAIRWASPRLDCQVELTAGVGPIAAKQLAPGVNWTCVVPGGIASVRFGDIELRGTGYAECIDLSVPPWALNITQLRWGRWISADARRSVVWIEWTLGGGHPERSEGSALCSWAFLDDKEMGVSRMTEDSVHLGDATLELTTPVTLIDRGLRGTVGKIAALGSIVPKWLLGGHERRRTRTGVLRERGVAIHGTAVDEIVDFG